ncbi:MAG: gamma-glutamylcyclotransferase [Actinomycetota bacterium]|nr:gamma-glutamylcyclotransferase [Actinomycetota bacterium]
MPFGDPEEQLHKVHGLEGYVPGQKSLYERVLIPVKVSDRGNVLAWTYGMRTTSGVYLSRGR